MNHETLAIDNKTKQLVSAVSASKENEYLCSGCNGVLTLVHNDHQRKRKHGIECNMARKHFRHVVDCDERCSESWMYKTAKYRLCNEQTLPPVVIPCKGCGSHMTFVWPEHTHRECDVSITGDIRCDVVLWRQETIVCVIKVFHTSNVGQLDKVIDQWVEVSAFDVVIGNSIVAITTHSGASRCDACLTKEAIQQQAVEYKNMIERQARLNSECATLEARKKELTSEIGTLSKATERHSSHNFEHGTYRWLYQVMLKDPAHFVRNVAKYTGRLDAESKKPEHDGNNGRDSAWRTTSAARAILKSANRGDVPCLWCFKRLPPDFPDWKCVHAHCFPHAIGRATHNYIYNAGSDDSDGSD